MVMTLRIQGNLTAVVALAFAALSACSDTVAETGGTGGNGAGGQGGQGGDGGDGGGGGLTEDCSEFEATPGAPLLPVTLRFVNQTGADLFLGPTEPGCGDYLPYSLADRTGEPLKPTLDSCEFECHSLLSGGCGCPAICAQVPVVRITENGSYDLVWAGAIYDALTMPAACYADESCAGTACFRATMPPSGDLTFTGTAHPELSGCDAPPCTCTPDASGSCTIDGVTEVSGTPIVATATYAYGGGGTEVEIVFE
jgi:hypothetical protein